MPQSCDQQISWNKWFPHASPRRVPWFRSPVPRPRSQPRPVSVIPHHSRQSRPAPYAPVSLPRLISIGRLYSSPLINFNVLVPSSLFRRSADSHAMYLTCFLHRFTAADGLGETARKTAGYRRVTPRAQCWRANVCSVYCTASRHCGAVQHLLQTARVPRAAQHALWPLLEPGTIACPSGADTGRGGRGRLPPIPPGAGRPPPHLKRPPTWQAYTSSPESLMSQSAHIRDTSERAELYTQHAPGYQHCTPAGIRVSHPAVWPPEVSKGPEVNFLATLFGL